jgi:hypothetical protein
LRTHCIRELCGSSCQHRCLPALLKNDATCPQSLCRPVGLSGEHLDDPTEMKVRVRSEAELIVQILCAADQAPRVIELTAHRLESCEPNEKVRFARPIPIVLSEKLFAARYRADGVPWAIVERAAEVA